MKYYCIASCDKCRTAKKALAETGIAHEAIDYRKDGLEADVLLGWIEAYGLAEVLNTKSATWRQLDDAQKALVHADPAKVILGNPAMLFRPLLDFGDHIVTGKAALDWLASQ